MDDIRTDTPIQAMNSVFLSFRRRQWSTLKEFADASGHNAECQDRKPHKNREKMVNDTLFYDRHSVLDSTLAFPVRPKGTTLNNGGPTVCLLNGGRANVHTTFQG